MNSGLVPRSLEPGSQPNAGKKVNAVAKPITPYEWVCPLCNEGAITLDPRICNPLSGMRTVQAKCACGAELEVAVSLIAVPGK